MVHSLDSGTNFFVIVTGILQRDRLAMFLFIICWDYVPKKFIDLMKENCLILKKGKKQTLSNRNCYWCRLAYL